jgi:uncharacterized membrane protein
MNWIAMFLVVGVIFVVLAIVAGLGKLPRNWVVGIKTTSTLHSEASWKASNRAGAAWMGAAGAVLLIGAGVIVALISTNTPTTTVNTVGTVALGAALVLLVAATVAGIRAANRVNSRQ